MSSKRLMVILPPTLKGPGMIKSPPLDIANLVSVLKLDANHVVLTDFRKNILDNPSFYKDKGVDLGIFSDFRKCLGHCVSEDVEVLSSVDRIMSEISFHGVEYVILSVAVLEQFSLPYLMASLCCAKQIKAKHRDIKVVLFGNCPAPHVKKIMHLFKWVDAFPVGGNEFSVADYIKRHDTDGPIKGIYYRKHHQLVVPTSPRRMDLDRLPIPDFSLFDLEEYKANGRLVLPYELGRGCINHCFYCYYIHKGSLHMKDPAKAVTELEILSQRYKTGLFHLMDAAINADPVWLMKFCDLMEDKGGKMRWSALAIPHMSQLLLDKLKKAGCAQLRWGVESGSARMLKKINKGITRKSIKETLRHSHVIGINNYITLISGLKCEVENDVKETNAFIQEISPYVDAAKECVYGELGHFSLSVFDSLMNKSQMAQQESRYQDVLARLKIGQRDIIDFMTR